MSVRLALALLALCSLAAASDPRCEELVEPQCNHTQVIGKWIFHAGISELKETEDELKAINSSWIEISAVADSKEMVLRWGDRNNEKCDYGSFKYNFSSNISKVTFEYNSTAFVGNYLKSCPDCLVWMDTMTNNEKGRSLYIFTKNGSLEDSYLEMFKKQASCVGFSGEIFFMDTTNLCPYVPKAKEEKEN
ncbi:unnamed protein product [Tetraodon nigroviridis]|uniref:(spotted green pufferfish) hypothetical protein n=1 Tax=Tetraodon nigroviridis TaxID=99883 RepID=Q4RUP7_TETNG|nr:unnamed protein product [Tetraodon nigroviridis]